MSCRIKINNEYIKSFTKKDTFNSVEEFQQAIYKVYGLDSIAAPVSLNKKDGVSFLQASVLTNANILLTVRAPFLKNITQKDGRIKTGSKKDSNFIYIPALQDENNNPVPDINTFTTLWLNNFFSPTADSITSLIDGGFVDTITNYSNNLRALKQSLSDPDAIIEKGEISKKFSENINFINSIIGNGGVIDYYTNLYREINQELSEAQLKKLEELEALVNETREFLEDELNQASSFAADARFKEYKYFSEKYLDELEALEKESEKTVETIEEGTEFSVVKSFGTPIVEDFDTSKIDNAEAAKIILTEMVNNAIINGINNQNVNFRIRYERDSPDFVQNRILKDNTSSPLNESQVNTKTSVVGIVEKYNTSTKQWERVYLKIKPESSRGNKKITLSDISGVDALSYEKLSENFELTTDLTQAYNISYELGETVKSSPVVTFRLESIERKDKIYQEAKKRASDALNAGTVLYSTIQTTKGIGAKRRPLSERNYSIENISIDNTQGSPYRGAAFIGNTLLERGTLPKDKKQEIMDLISYSYSDMESEVLEGVVAYIKDLIEVGDFIPVDTSTDLMNRINIPNRTLGISVVPDPDNPNNKKIQITVFRYKQDGKFIVAAKKPNLVVSSKEPNLARFIEMGLDAARIHIPKGEGTKVGTYKRAYKVVNGKVQKVDWSVEDQHKFILDNTKTKYYNSDGVNVNLDRVFVVSKKIETYNPSVKEEKKDPVVVKNVNKAPLVTPTPTPTPLSIERLDIEIGDEITTETLANAEKALRESAQTDIVDLSGLDPAEISGNLPVLTKEQEAELEAAILDKGTVIEEFYLDTEDVQETSDFLSLAEQYDSTQEKLPKEISMSGTQILDIFDMVAPEFKSSLNPNSAALLTLAQKMLGEDTIFIFGSNTDTNSSVASFSLYEEGVEGLKDSESIEDKIMYDRLVKAAPDRIGSIKKVITINSNTYLKLKELQSKQQRSPQQQSQLNSLSEKIGNSVLEEIVHAMTFDKLITQEVQSSEEFKDLTNIVRDLRSVEKSGKLKLTEEEKEFFDYYIGAEIGTNDKDVSIEKLAEFLVSPHRKELRSILSKAQKNIQFPKKDYKSLYEFVLDKFKNLFEYLFKGLLSQSPQLEEVVSGETLAIILNKLHQSDNSAESIVKNLNVEVGDQIEAFNSDPKVKSAVENSVKGTKEEEEFLKSSEIQAGVQPPINPTSTSEVGDRIKNKIKGGLKNPKTTLYSIDPAYSSNFSTMKGIEKMFKKADVKKGAAAHIDSILSNILWGENIFSDFIQNNLSTEDILEILSDTLLLEIEQTPSQERKNYLTYLRNNLSDIWLKNSNLFKASIEKSSDITPDIKNEFNADKNQEFSEKEEIGIDGETLSDQDVMDITGGVDSSRFQERTEQKLSSVQEAGRLAQIFVRMLPKLDLDKDGNIQYEYIGGEDGIKVVKTQVDSFGNYKTVNYTEIWNALAEVMQGCLTIDEMIEALNTKHLKFKEMEVFRDRVMAIGSTFNDNLLIKDLEKSFQKILNPTMLVIEEVVEEEKGRKSELDEILEAEGITTNVKDSKYNTENSAFNHKIYSSTKLDAINIQNVISGLFREKYEKNMDGIFPDYKAVLNDITSNVDMAVLRTPSKSSQWNNLYKYWANVGVNFEAGNKIPEGLKRQLMMQLSEFTIALVDKMEAMEKKDVPASEAELIAFDVFDFVKNTQTTTKGKFPSNSAVVSNLMDLFTEVLPYSTSNMSKNAEGENQSNLHNFSSYLINLKYLSSISTANSKQEQINLVKKEIPRLNNPIAKYSWVIGKLEDGVKIEPVNISGTQKEDSGVNTINLKYIPYLRQQIHTLLKEGFKENLRAETASSSFGFRLVSNKTVLPVGKRSIKKDTETRLNAYFKGEIERIFREKVNKVLGKGKYNFKYENQREQFTIMSGMLSGEFKNALQAKMNEYIASLPQGTLNEISNQGEALETSMMELFAGIKELDINGNKVNAFTRLNSEIGNYLKSEVLDFKNYLKNETFIDGSVSPNVEVDRTHPIFADTFIQKEIDELPNITGESQIDTFLSYYLSNFIIMSIEETILFHGELGQQDKFYKRSKSNMSNGTPVIINDRLKELLKRDSISGSFSETLGGKKPEYYENPDRMKSFIISDDEMSINDAQAANMKLGLVESLLMTAKEFGRKLTREQAEARAEEIISGYSKSTVSDGGGFVHPDAYRLMLMGVGAWSREREEGYLYEMVKYKEKKGISLNESEMELKSLVETKIKKLGIYYTFPVVKFQYRGAGLQEGEMNQTVTAVEMLDKFALTPLFPSFVEGKVGEDILRAMTNSSSAYGKFASGTKIGQFEMNNLSDFKSIETPNGIHFVQTQYLKEQVKTPDKVKKESLFGSQVRKLMISNLSINGKFIESIFPFYKEWKDSQSEFAVRERDTLYKELGVDEGTLSRLKSYQERGESTEGINLNIDLSKLVKLMRKEVEKRDIPEALKEFFYNDSLTDQEVGDVFFEMSLSPSIVENMLYSVLKNRIVKVKFPGAHLVQSPSSLFTSKNEEDLNSQGRDLEYYRVDEKTGEILPAQCKIALQGDFKNLLNHPLVKEYGYGLEALNKALKNPEVRKALKDHITIFAYRIPTQGFNSMDVLEIVEFLPEPLGNTIIPPPQIVTKSGTDYDYDKMPTVFPQIGEDGQLIKGESYRLIQASKGILLNKLNFYRLVTPNTTEYVIDRLNNILEKIYGGTDVNPDPKNTNIFSPVTHLKKWLAVKIKDLLGVAAVNNTYYSLMQEAGFVLNEKYTIEGNELTFTPKLLSEKEREKIVNKITDPFIIGEDVDKLEIINQFINLFVDAASNDIAGYTNIKKENIGFVIMQTMVGVPFDRILKFIHQPIIYRYHQYVDSLVANGNTLSEAKKYALEELLGISLIKETKYGFANKSNQELWEEVIDLSRSVEGFDSSDLESQLITKDRIAGVSNARFRNSPSQTAALAYYLIGLQEADLLREAQSFTNHDTTISPSLGVSGIREEMYKKIEEADLISQDSLQKIKNGLIGFLNIHEDFEKLSNLIFPILGSPIHQEILGEMGTNVFESKREKFVNSFNNDFLLFLIQNFDANFQERYSKLKEMQQNGSLLVEWNRLKKEYNLEDTSLAKHLYPVNTKKGSGANPALFMGLDNSSEEFNKILSEIRQMQSLVGNDKRATDLRNFANNLVELGFYQTGFTPSRIYMLKVLPPDFLLGYKDIFKTFNNLSIEQKKIVYSTFKSTFLRHQVLNFGSSFIDYFGSSYDGERNAARNDKDRFVLPNLYSKALVPKLNQYNETLNKKLEKEKEQTLANTQNNPQAFFTLVDSLPVGKFSTEVSTISIETVKPVVEPVAETTQTKPLGQEIKNGVFVNQDGLTQEEQLELFKYLKPIIEEQAAKTNKGSFANKMIGLGLRWDYKSNNFGVNKMYPELGDRMPINVGKTIGGRESSYGYWNTSINNQPLYPITDRMRYLISKATGIDVKDYDGAIVNIYDSSTFIGNHSDIDESATAIKYPVVAVNIGGNGNFIAGTNKDYVSTDLAAGAGYSFGYNGVNRTIPHSTARYKISKGFLPEITTKLDDRTYKAGQYRITITLRRIMPLEAGMPEVPNLFTSSVKQELQPVKETKIETQTEVTNSKYELFPGVYANLGQRTAIDKIEEFLSKDSSKVKDQKENLFLLKGRGGTGKTTIIKKALEGVPGVVIGATVADEARQVLQENMKGYTTATMASLLGLIVDYKEGKEFFRKRTEREIDEYEAKGGTIPIKKASILVIDEASMISDALWEILMDMKKPNTKIIFMGDNVQIPPIQENGTSKDSPVWDLITSDNFSELSERMRQKAESPILGITDLYANNVENIQNNRPFITNPLKLRQTTINDKGEGVIYVKENSELVDMYIKDFKSSKDLKEAVVVAARLDSVAFINNSIRKKLFNTEEPYVVGERIRVNTPYVRDNQVVMTNGLKGEINSVKKTKLDGVDLDVYNITATFQNISPSGEVEFNSMNFNTIDPQDSKKFAAAKSKLAKAAEVFRKGTSEYKIAWAKYYHLKGLIVDIGYAYAITAHKVQGSTYNSTYVLENDVMSFPGGTEQQNRMMYTAVSRPRKKLVIFNPAQAIDPITKYFIDEVDLVKVLENIPELKGKDHESIITNFFAKFNDECNGDRAIAVNFIYSGLKRQDKKEITLNLLKECF